MPGFIPFPTPIALDKPAQMGAIDVFFHHRRDLGRILPPSFSAFEQCMRATQQIITYIFGSPLSDIPQRMRALLKSVPLKLLPRQILIGHGRLGSNIINYLPPDVFLHIEA